MQLHGSLTKKSDGGLSIKNNSKNDNHRTVEYEYCRNGLSVSLHSDRRLIRVPQLDGKGNDAFPKAVMQPLCRQQERSDDWSSCEPKRVTKVRLPCLLKRQWEWGTGPDRRTVLCLTFQLNWRLWGWMFRGACVKSCTDPAVLQVWLYWSTMADLTVDCAEERRVRQDNWKKLSLIWELWRQAKLWRLQLQKVA